MAASFSRALVLMILSWVSGYISVYIFQNILVPDAHFFNDMFACNNWNIHDLYKLNCYTTFPSVYIPSIIYTLLDKYYEYNNILHLKRIYNPGYRPLYKIPWQSVEKATIRTFFTVYQYILFQTFISVLFWQWRGMCDSNYSFWSQHILLNVLIVIIYVILYAIIADIIFYSGHRLAHESAFLYQNVHKIHHQWVDTVGIASSASSFWENLIVGIPTITFTPFILKLPLGFAYTIMCLGGISTICGHSGYEYFLGIFPITNPGGIPHDYHHHFRNCEFGSGGGITDWLFKTRIEDIYPWKNFMLKINQDQPRTYNSKNA
eukprot:543205_1